MLKYFCTFTISVLAVVAQAQQDSVKTLDINLSNYNYPYPVQYLSLSAQQQKLQIAYMDIAPTTSANNKVVLLLHGKNFNGAYWGQTAKALAAKGFRVIVPDQVGFGRSSKPVSLQYSFQLLAQNTKALLDSLHLTSIIVVGHSMGGMVASRFVLMYPITTEKLVLVNPIGLEDWKLSVPYTSIDKQYAKELGQTYASLKKYEQQNYYHGTWLPQYDEWLNLLAGWLGDKQYPLVAWNNALTSDMIFTQPVCYEFKHITAPSLLIIGQADRTAIGKESAPPDVQQQLGNYSQLGKLTQQQIPGSKLVEIPGVGHLPHIEAFDIFIKALLEFLK